MTDLEKFIQKYGGVTEEYRFYNNTVVLRYDVNKHVYYKVTGDALIKQDGVTNICHIIDKSSVLIPWACKMMEQKLQKSVEPYLSPTQLIIDKKEFDDLVKSAKSAHKDKLEAAGAIGHETHGWIETFIKGVMSGSVHEKPLDLPDETKALSAVTAALDWIKRHNVRWIHTERKIYSLEHSYAGTMDGLCLADSCDNPACCPEHFKDRRTLVDWKTSNYLYVEYILQTAAYKYAYEEETNEKVDDIWIIRLGKTDSKFEAWHLPQDLILEGWLAFYEALQLARGMQKINNLVKEMKEKA